MKHIVLTILLLLSITGSSQVTDEEWLVDYLGYNLIEITTYEMEIGISPECFSAIPISCYLNLYQDGYYYIEASYNTSDDMVTGFVISDGEYVFNDSILILNDSYGKANMKFIKRGDDLYPIEVYYFMKEKPMHFCRTEKVKDNKQYIEFRNATESEGKERIERFASKYNKEKYQLKYGKCFIIPTFITDSEENLKKFKEMAIESNAYVVLEVKQKSDLVKSVPIFNNL